MKRVFLTVIVLITSCMLMSLIVRHDISDEQFIVLGKDYPQICHLANGEATLIRKDWVVTAAHAAIILQKQLQNGTLPQLSINKTKYDVEKVILHPDFTMSRTKIANDIALIKIKGAVKNIPTAKLYKKQDENGQQITIVGRGDFGTGLSGPIKQDKITRAATNKIDGTSAQWIYFTFDPPKSKNATALEGISGPGDSGGPAFVDVDGVRYIIGVSSHQMNNGKEGVYGVTEYYTRISVYKKWIENNIK